VTYAHAPEPIELPPVLMELPEGADADGSIVTGTYLNVGLGAETAGVVTKPMPIEPGDPMKRQRRNAAFQIAFIVLSITAGGLLAASSDIPHPAEGVANWAEVATLVAFPVAMLLGAMPKILRRKYVAALKAWVAEVERTAGLRNMLVRIDSIEDPALLAEIRELGESLTQSRHSAMIASGDGHDDLVFTREIFGALSALAHYALHPDPQSQHLAREAVFTFANRVDNYVHTGNPDKALGDLKA